MAFSEDTVASDVSTEAGFEALVQKIHDAFAAVGLVQTADTGQINLAGTNTPAVSTYAGYEIWRFDDAAQATDPIFFKIQYGWTSATGRLRLEWTVGTASNGSGALSNASNSMSTSWSSVPQAATNARIIASFVNGALLLGVSAPSSSNTAITGNSMLGTIERLRDPETFALKAGCFYTALVDSSANPPFLDFWLRQGGAWSASNTCKGVAPSALGGNKVAVGFHLPRLAPYAPLRAVLSMVGSTLADNDTGEIIVHGAAADYKKVAFPFADHTNLVLSHTLVCTD